MTSSDTQSTCTPPWKRNATFIRLVHLDGCRDVIAGDVVTTSIVELEHVNRSRLVLTDRRFAGGCVRHDVIVIVARRFHDICKQDICVVRCAAVLKRQSLPKRNRIEPARYNVKSIFVTKFQPMILSLIMDPHNLTISMATTRCTYLSFHRISQKWLLFSNAVLSFLSLYPMSRWTWSDFMPGGYKPLLYTQRKPALASKSAVFDWPTKYIIPVFVSVSKQLYTTLKILFISQAI